MCWSSVLAFANSNFFTALAGALTGAFAGAYAAQRVIERAKRRDELISEIRQTNAAMSISFTAFNAAIAMKRQHVMGLFNTWSEDKKRAIAFLQDRAAGRIHRDTPFEFRAELVSLPQIRLPGDAISKHIFERLSVTGRPLSLSVALSQLCYSLDAAITRRNELIEKLKAIPADNRGEFVRQFFGIPNSEGTTISEYPDTLSAMLRYLDDAIFFSKLLCVDLREHGLILSQEFEDRFRRTSPRVSEVDFEDERVMGLVPSDADYQDWLTGFPKFDEEQK